MSKNHPGKNARLRAKKRMLRATQALLNGTATTIDDDPLAGLTNTQRTKKRVRQATQQRLKGIEIRTQADAAIMKHTMDQAIEENKDWRLRVETVNAGFQENQRVGLRLGLENMQRVAAGHDALQDHVKREGVKMEIVGAKMEMVNEDVGDLRQEDKALREKIVELEAQLQEVRDAGSALRAEFQQLRDSIGREGGSRQEGANEEGWKGRLRSRKKA
ncbi:hypothetical protein K4K52_002163 [Colletotrichum sp. SAR 10_76]|nr:hypothetical protein K4K52_002163 [Colletotrichum sp. SAR 10_76]